MITPEQLRGTGVALVTPFTPGKEVDFRALENMINFVIDNRVDFLVILGTTAETATLTEKEQQLVVNTVIRVNNGRVPLILGMGGNNTAKVVDTINKTNFERIDAILSVTPYYNKPNQEGLYLHYKEISLASPVPIVLYNVPSRTGANLESATTLQLAREFDNIIAVKEASGNFIQIMDLIKNRPKDFLVLSGDDATTFPLVTLGGDGVISVIANAFPLEFSQMVRDALNDDLNKSKAMHFRFTDIIKDLFIEGNPAGVKALLNVRGLVENELRLPLVPVSRETFIKLKQQIEEFYR